MVKQDEEYSVEELRGMMRTHSMYECQDCMVEFMASKIKNYVFCPICYSTKVLFLFDPEEQLHLLSMLRKSDYWEVDDYAAD
tara:strand:- start:280 stop:525 length:246 start_codon:yes stop_codon:yes gene_type:complete